MSKVKTGSSDAGLQPALSPEEYGQIIDGLELHTILMDSVQATVDRVAFEAIERIPIEFEEVSSYSTEDGFTVNTSLSASCVEEDKRCFDVKADYTLVFSSQEDITPEFFEVFRALNLPLYIWPFFRELVNSMTQRMSIPPLTLPLHKPSFGSEAE